MQQPDFDIDELCYAIEAKDNIKKVRVDYENLKLVNSNLNKLLGDNMDFYPNTIKFAFKVLLNHFKLWMDNWNDNDQLSQIEVIFNNFTKIQTELHTYGIKNKDLKAFAFYGLHAVNFIRGEYRISIINIFKIFIINPRMARYNLCSDIYNYHFHPLISEALKTEFVNMAKKPKCEDCNDSIEKMRTDSDLRRYRLEEIEQKIDYECICIAEKTLQEFIGDLL
ncbi:MAG: hypothetical protein PHF63_04600 [Herbinix sp.]|nr:hypothetical protein [Herbinix sp.]